jgi:hypothetical protein
MVRAGLADATEGVAWSGASDDCAAAIPVAVPATSKTHIHAATILIEGQPFQDNFSNTLAISDAALYRGPRTSLTLLNALIFSYPAQSTIKRLTLAENK